MKLLAFLFLSIAVLECTAQQSDSIEMKSLILDTLIIDGIKYKARTNFFSVKPQSDRILFKQTIYNATADTINLRVTPDKEWVVPESDSVVSPKGCLVISYMFLPRNDGIVY